MRSQRQLRVGEAIRHALAGMFLRGDVPWPSGFVAPIITITEVTVSPDLRNATAYYLVMGSQNGTEIQRVLRGISGFFRHVIAQEVKMRYVPELVFRLDTSFDYASNIEKILNDPSVAKDLRNGGVDRDDEGEEP